MGLERLKVFIIYDSEKYDKELILEELASENFNHYFQLSSQVDRTEGYKYIDECDEVWTFGDVNEFPLFEYAMLAGCEIWEMG